MCFGFARRLQSCAAVVFLSLSSNSLGQPAVAPSEPLTAEQERQKFHLPPGFEIQLVASEPEIHKPININFDNRGRLWVTDTVEYPFPAKPDAVPRDTVKVLVDRNNDGKADEVTTFLDGLNIPLGVQPIAQGAIVYSIASVKKCLDTNGDGKADTREDLYTGFGFRDTHGMVNSFNRGLDGWLYACHGFSNDSDVKGSDGQAIHLNSGNTFRMRLDGSHVEYFTHGQVNPFGLSIDPLGNMYSADCHTLPLYMLLRGAFYPSFGKVHDGLDFGPTMLGHNHGSSGIGGVAYYAAEQFPPAYRDTIFVGNPVTGKVNHDRLEPHGSTYKAIETPDFLTCDDPWFRPVNLLVGPDGALYIADFYNRIIGHYEVPLNHPGRDRERGRIWRVVYNGKDVKDAPPATAPTAPNIAEAKLDALVELLGHGNLTVRTLATHELVDRFPSEAAAAVKQLISGKSSTWQRAHGLWVLERLGALDASLIESLSKDAERAVRVHLMKALAERKDWDANLAALVRAGLIDEDGCVRRAAADALGRHPQAENIKPLLVAWTSAPADDSHLVHVLRMALRDQLVAPGMCAEALKLVGDDRAGRERLANVILGAPTSEAADLLWQQLKSAATPQLREQHLHHVVRYLGEDKLGEVFTYAIGLPPGSPEEQLALVRGVGRALQERGAKAPPQFSTWAGRTAHQLLAGTAEPQVKSGIELAKEFEAGKDKAVYEMLAKVAGAESRFPALRQPALDACMAIDPAGAVGMLAGVLGNAADAMPLRQSAAAALGRVNSDASRQSLATHLQTAPESLALAIGSALADSAPGAELLLTAIAAGKASPRLLQESAVEGRIRARGLADIDKRLSGLTAGMPARDARVRELIARRKQSLKQGKADVAVGATVFQKNCANCHRIGENGAKVGPNLDGMGVRGVDRLLEDVLDPNRNVDQAFRTTQIVTTDGRILSGLALREEGKVLVLADAQGKEQRVTADEIDQRSVSPVSLMPANLAEQITEPDFRHLFEYLLAQQQQPPAK